MARLEEDKGDALSSKSSSEVKDAAKTEVYAPSPMIFEGEENGESVEEVAEVEKDGTEITSNAKNALEEEGRGCPAAEKQEEDNNRVLKEKNGESAVGGEASGSNGADKQEEDGDHIDNGENAVGGRINGSNSAEEDDVDCANKKNNGENAAEGGVNECNAATKQEEKGNCVDGENSEKNAYEQGKGEECIIEKEDNNQQDAIKENKTVGENKGSAADENKHDVEKENSKEQQTLVQQNKKSRKRIRIKKRTKGPAGKVAPQSDKPEMWHTKKLKMMENDMEQGGQTRGNGECEILNNKENTLDGSKGKQKVAVGLEDGGENVKEKDEKEVGESSKKRVINLKRLKRRNDVAERASENLTSKGKGKRGSLNKNKVSKKAETKGMIFMCSSRTKQDCYRYKVFGLPERKRNTVERIYKGMKLFLYDVDLKLLYGIYKAAGQGGYNIEPKAFSSQFPSQVRFKILENFVPLPEEKFRKVIKDNYYTRTKFGCELNLEQVINLQKVFVSAGKVTRSMKLGRSARAEKKKLDRDRTRRRNEVGVPPLRDEFRQPPFRNDARRPPMRDEVRHHSLRVDVRHPLLRIDVRHPPLRDESRQHEHALVHRSPVALLPQFSPLPLPTTAPSYAYERTLQREAYCLEPPVERHGSYSQSRLLDLQDALRQEPHIEQRRIYRQDQLLEHHDSYRREPLLEHRDSFTHAPHVEHRDSYRREPLVEHSDSYKQERRREPLIEFGDSYRQERLLEPRDLYSRDARLEQPVRRVLEMEPRHHSEVESQDLHISYRERPSYSDRLYSTSRAPGYHRQVEMPAEGHSNAYHSTKRLLSEYYSRRPAY